jgi:hypothetical protein
VILLREAQNNFEMTSGKTTPAKVRQGRRQVFEACVLEVVSWAGRDEFNTYTYHESWSVSASSKPALSFLGGDPSHLLFLLRSCYHVDHFRSFLGRRSLTAADLKVALTPVYSTRKLAWLPSPAAVFRPGGT